MSLIDDTILNSPVDFEKPYSEITDTFTELIDLGTDETYRGLSVANETDADIVIDFYNKALNEYFPVNYVAGSRFSFDRFSHNGVIRIKYKTDAPTEGYFKITSWRAE